MLQVSDIMSQQVFTVHEDDSLEEAVFLFNTELLSGAPVRDREGTIIGIISKTDIVDEAETEHEPLGMERVGDAMRTPIWSVPPIRPRSRR